MKIFLINLIFYSLPLCSFSGISIKELMIQLKPLEKTYSVECSKTINFQNSMIYRTCKTKCLGYEIFISDIFDFGHQNYRKNLDNVTVILNENTMVKIVNFFSKNDMEIVIMDSNFFPLKSFLIDENFEVMMLSEYEVCDGFIIERAFRSKKLNLFDYNLEDLIYSNHKLDHYSRYYQIESYIVSMISLLNLFG